MIWSPVQILEILDQGSRAFTFPMLDNGYLYLAATRMSLFRSEPDWAIVFEIFGFSPRAGSPDLQVCTFASNLYRRDPPENYASQEAYANYLRNNPFNDSRYFFPIEAGPWEDEENPEQVADECHVVLRSIPVQLPKPSEYLAYDIRLEAERPAVFELCRYLAAIKRNDVLATQQERTVSILPGMKQVLLLDEWHHPDLASGELPSEVQSFRQLAKVLATGNPSLYQPSTNPNSHWKNWPEGGRL